jgi:hypothetical protein
MRLKPAYVAWQLQAINGKLWKKEILPGGKDAWLMPSEAGGPRYQVGWERIWLPCGR